MIVFNIFLLVLIMIFPSKVYATCDNWCVAANTTLAIDWLQTRDIANDPNRIEANRILGPYPSQNKVNRYFISSIFIMNYLGQNLSPKYGKYLYISVAAVETNQVIQNYRVGVRLRF